MYLSTGSTITITGSTFSNGYAEYGGAIYILGSADVSIQTSNFTSNTAQQGGAIHATTYNSFTISNNCYFTSNNANSKVGECIYITNAFEAFSVANSYFTVTNNAIYLKRTQATISSCTFTGTAPTVNELDEYAGGIEFEEVPSGKITSSTFTSLKGKGGAFKISSNAYFKQQEKVDNPTTYVSYTITDSTITNCESVTHGGGIYVDTIKDVTLTN